MNPIESLFRNPDSLPESLFMMLNQSETQMFWWTISKESWKTILSGHKKHKKMSLISFKSLKAFKPLNTFGSDAQTREFPPMKSSDLNQESFSCTETSLTKRHCQILTLWQSFNMQLNTWKWRTLLSVVITDVVVWGLHSREKITGLWSLGFHTSEI